MKQAMHIADGEPLSKRRERLHARVASRLPGRAERAIEFLGELIGVASEAPSAQLRAARADPILMGDQIRRAWEEWVTGECTERPVVLVLEDLHWGEKVSSGSARWAP